MANNTLNGPCSDGNLVPVKAEGKKRLVLWLLLIGVAVLVRLVALARSPVVNADAYYYVQYARLWNEKQYRDVLLSGYHPLYPILTAQLQKWTGSYEKAGYAISLLWGVLSLIPLIALFEYTRRHIFPLSWSNIRPGQAELRPSSPLPPVHGPGDQIYPTKMNFQFGEAPHPNPPPKRGRETTENPRLLGISPPTDEWDSPTSRLLKFLTSLFPALLLLLLFLHPLMLRSSVSIKVEAAYGFFFLTGLLFFLYLLEERWTAGEKALFALICGISIGLAFLTHPEGILLLLFAAVGLGVYLFQHRWLWVSITFQGGLVALSCMITIFPFLFVLSRLTGHFTPSSKWVKVEQTEVGDQRAGTSRPSKENVPYAKNSKVFPWTAFAHQAQQSLNFLRKLLNTYGLAYLFLFILGWGMGLRKKKFVNEFSILGSPSPQPAWQLPPPQKGEGAPCKSNAFGHTTGAEHLHSSGRPLWLVLLAFFWLFSLGLFLLLHARLEYISSRHLLNLFYLSVPFLFMGGYWLILKVSSPGVCRIYPWGLALFFSLGIGYDALEAVRGYSRGDVFQKEAGLWLRSHKPIGTQPLFLLGPEKIAYYAHAHLLGPAPATPQELKADLHRYPALTTIAFLWKQKHPKETWVDGDRRLQFLHHWNDPREKMEVRMYRILRPGQKP